MNPLPQEALEQRILHGLAREWDLAIAWLPHSLTARLRPPLFALLDLGTCWGRWTGDGKREMAFSRELVLNHSWDAVTDVLRHELAHQIAEECLNAAGETVHGPTFHRACTLVGANPCASAGFPPLDTRVFRGAEPHAADQLLMRIRKLLALAQSPNPHEAERAMRKAHDLIARYNVDLLKHDSQRQFVSVFLGRPALRHSREEHRLADLLQEYYFVRCIWASAYVLERARMGRVLEISGSVENVRVAHYIYDFVRRHIAAEWELYCRQNLTVHGDRTFFAVGLLTGFAEKLRAQRAPAPATSGARAVVRLQDPQLNAYFAQRFPHTVRGRSNYWAPDSEAFAEGRSRGKALVIHRGVEAGAISRRGNLLPPPA
jgi:hypothetical protein